MRASSRARRSGQPAYSAEEYPPQTSRSRSATPRTECVGSRTSSARRARSRRTAAGDGPWAAGGSRPRARASARRRAGRARGCGPALAQVRARRAGPAPRRSRRSRRSVVAVGDASRVARSCDRRYARANAHSKPSSTTSRRCDRIATAARLRAIAVDGGHDEQCAGRGELARRAACRASAARATG